MECKPSILGPRHLNQIIGNAVIIHKNRHPHQNSLVPVVGLSGARATLMVVSYDPIPDTLLYTFPYNWLYQRSATFLNSGLLLLWLCLYHNLFLKQLHDLVVCCGLQERFEHDGVLDRYRELTRINVSYWPPATFNATVLCKRKRKRKGTDE